MNKQKKFMARNKGITLIALVITIIVLLILAGVTINTLFDNGNAIEKAAEAKEEDSHGNVKDQIQLEITNYQLAKGLGETDATSSIEYLSGKEYFKEEYASETESYTIKSDKISNVALGKGTDKTSGDVYVVEKDENDWKLKYYKESNDENPRILLSLSVSNTNVKPDKVLATNVSELVAGDYVDYVYEKEDGSKVKIPCRVLYDTQNENNFGVQLISINTVGEAVELGYRGIDWTVQGEWNQWYADCEMILPDLKDYENIEICSLVRLVNSDPITGSLVYDTSGYNNYGENDEKPREYDYEAICNLGIAQCGDGQDYWLRPC